MVWETDPSSKEEKKQEAFGKPRLVGQDQVGILEEINREQSGWDKPYRRLKAKTRRLCWIQEQTGSQIWDFGQVSCDQEMHFVSGIRIEVRCQNVAMKEDSEDCSSQGQEGLKH